jgi:threonine/homoserine/homoserine lactone efflux protein
MIEPTALLAWSALALAVTLVPGPDTLLVASHAARGGLRAGMAALAGVTTGVVWYGALIAFGALSLLVAVPALFLAVKIVGAIYLAWLGFGMLRNALKGEAPDAVKPIDLKTPYAQGFLTNALNPKVAIFYLAALPQFIGEGANATAVGLVLLGVHALIGFVWLSFIAFAASRARAIKLHPNVSRWLEGAVGVFFVGVAGRLAIAQR